MTHRICFCVLVFFCFLVTGCANARIPRPEPRNTISLPNSRITVYGLSKDQPGFEYLTEALSRMPEPVRNSVYFFAVHADNSDGHFDNEPAHCHSHAKKICILKKEFRSYIDGLECVWHETAHAYFVHLPSSALEEWKLIAGKVYGRAYDAWADSFHDRPMRGCLTLYSLTDYDEDVAEFVKAAYSYCYLYKPHKFFGMDYFSAVNKNDKRYLLKLEFLLKWGFITREMFEAIESLLKSA